MKIATSTRLALMGAFIALFVYSCSNNGSEDPENKSLRTQAELSTTIDSLKGKLSDPMSNEEAMLLSQELKQSCLEFVDVYPKDDRCADYLFIASRAANGLGEYEESLKILNRIKKGYVGYVKMPEVYFLYAFTLDEDMEKKEEAKEAYLDLISEFPDEPLSAQARVLLEQLYMSDEELIEMWKMKEKTNS